MNLQATLACCIAIGLAGCTSPAPPDGTPAAAARAAPSSSAIHGTATYVERMRMPPGASLRVELLDAASDVPVSTALLRDVAGPPIPFTIARLPGGAPNGGYALRAVLLGPQGERWFETPAPVAAPAGVDGIELRMRRVAAGDAAPAASGRGVAHWECGELGVMSRFDDSGAVRLDFNGDALVLPLARSASGARYADARGNEFWTKGATGHLTLAGSPARECVEAAQPSPWNLAMQRGAVFRAVGNEPGWFAAIFGRPAMLDATLDHGERTLHVPVHAVGDGFAGVSGGEAVRLDARRARCSDGMSGQTFEATVTLAAGSKTWHGCGAWLQD